MSDIVSLSNPALALDGISGPGASSGEARAEQKALGQADFFKLLTTQLASQDPLEPMDDTAFIAQMAQFSTLEMMSDQTKAFDRLADGFELQSSRSIIGNLVTLQSGSDEVSGFVERVSFDDKEGMTRIFVNGRGYDMATMKEVGATSTDFELSTLAGKIGRRADLNEPIVDPETGNSYTGGRISGVERLNGNLKVTLDGRSRRFDLSELKEIPE